MGVNKKLLHHLFIISILVVLGSSFATVVRAQMPNDPPTTPREIADFSYQYEKYRELYPEFEAKRNEFLKHQTLASQNEAVDLTQQLIAQRAQTLRTFFYALKYQINSNEGVDISERSRISAGLDNEIGWMVNHKDDVEGMKNPSLSQLFEISSRIEDKASDLRIQAYIAKSYHIIGKIRTLYAQYITVNNNLDPYIEKGIETASYLKNWKDEAQSGGHQALAAIKRAEGTVKELARSGQNYEATLKVYTIIFNELETAKRYLATGSGFQKEIVKALDELLPKETATESANPQEATTPEVVSTNQTGEEGSASAEPAQLQP